MGKSLQPNHKKQATQTCIAFPVISPCLSLSGLHYLARCTRSRRKRLQLLVHSPVAPTVELLDMLRSYFPAIGPTAKVGTDPVRSASRFVGNTNTHTCFSRLQKRDPEMFGAWKCGGFQKQTRVKTLRAR